METFRCLAIIIMINFVIPCATKMENGGHDIVCYYSKTSYFPPSEVPHYLCTHIIYAFGSISENTIKPVRPDDVVTYGVLVGFKVMNPQLKVLLSLQHGFDSVVISPDVMKKFAINAIGFLRHYGFDGVDFDWEFPKPSQNSSYMQFIQIFRELADYDAVSMKQTALIISMALGNNWVEATSLYDYSILNKNIDFATIMAYDFHLYIPKSDNITGYNSALVSPKGESPYYSTTGIVELYLRLGLAAQKVVVGIPLYGRSYTLASVRQHELHAPAVGKGEPSPVRHLKGVYTFTDSCAALKDGATSVWDSYSGVPYMYHGKTWVSYADQISVGGKVHWAKARGVGGVGVWGVHLDDLTGTCAGPKLPLMNAIHNAMYSRKHHSLN